MRLKKQNKCSLKIFTMKNIFLLLSIILFTSSCSVNKTIYVADLLSDCDGDSSKKCLKIKEALEDDWVLINDQIEGFDYKEGYTYKMEVNATKIKNASEEEHVYKYKLVNLIYQEKTKSSNEQLSFKGKWKISNLVGMDSLAKSPTLNIDLDAKKISGNAGCNSYGTDFTIEGDQIKFGIPIATKMMCSNMKIEKAFFDCLQNTSYYKIVEGELIFYAKDGKEQMTCTRSEE